MNFRETIPPETGWDKTEKFAVGGAPENRAFSRQTEIGANRFASARGIHQRTVVQTPTTLRQAMVS
jgi:hypothetical protein